MKSNQFLIKDIIFKPIEYMTYEDFLKEFIEENKDKVSRDKLFGGYDISKYDSNKLTDKCYEFISDKINTEYPRPDINSEEYHDYYRNMMVMKAFCEAFQKYASKLTYLPKPPSTEVYCGQRD